MSINYLLRKFIGSWDSWHQMAVFDGCFLLFKRTTNKAIRRLLCKVNVTFMSCIIWLELIILSAWHWQKHCLKWINFREDWFLPIVIDLQKLVYANESQICFFTRILFFWFFFIYFSKIFVRVKLILWSTKSVC